MSLAADVKALTIADKLRLMDMLWDDLRHVEDQVEVPAWHKTLLDERLKRAEDRETEMLDWETVKDQLNRNVR
ncbi:MAG: addiction module protein [Luteolibacter sp.]